MVRRRQPVDITPSVTETAADYESSDTEQPPPPPLLLAENSANEEASPHESPKKKGRKIKPVPASSPNVATSRNSKRTRKPNSQYYGDDIYEYYTAFKASNRRRRLDQSEESEATKAKETDESNVDEVAQNETSTESKNDSAKENETRQIKAEAITINEEEVSPSPPKAESTSPPPQPPSIRIVSKQLHSPPQTYDASTAPSNSFVTRPSYVPDSTYLNPTRVIIPRAAAPQRMFPYRLPAQRYKTIGGFQCTTPNTLANVLPQYQDKRLRGTKESIPVECPDCRTILKNQDSYNTHRNYAHGQVKRAKIVCPESDCVVRSTNMNALVLHLRNNHRHPLRYETFNFHNQQEYEEWYKNLTQDGSVSFIRSSGIKDRDKGNNSISLIFYCNRSARRENHVKGVTNSNKMQAACPAYFRMTKYQNGTITIYAQLTHIGHDCIPKFKPIDSYPPLRTALNDIEKKHKEMKELSQAMISSEYSLENNSLVNSCLDILNNVAYELNRARNLLDGIIPGRKMDDDEIDPSFRDDILKAFETDDLDALSPPPDGKPHHDYSLIYHDDDDDDEEDEIQVLNESSTENGLINGYHSSSQQPGPSRKMSSYDQDRLEQYRKMPILLANGRVQCAICAVILKTFESYNVHRNTQHGLKPLNRSAMRQPEEPPAEAHDFDKTKLCSVCHLNFMNSNLNHILFCNCCMVAFHRGCNNGHIAVCSSASNMRY